MSLRARKTTGLTLVEMTLVIATIAIMAGLAVPAMRTLVRSFQSEGGVISMINASLNSARTMAVSRQRYVGVRFQKLCTSTDPADPLKGLMDAPQYMIFIVHEETTNSFNLEDGFRAMEGQEPIKLPGSMGIMELNWITQDTEIDEPFELSDATTFSIVFSPAGKLVAHDVRVRNRDGVYRPDNTAGGLKVSMDDVFNSVENICRPVRQGMFLQDDYSPRKNGSAATDSLNYGLGEELTCTSFVLYETPQLRVVYDRKTAWTDYLSRLSTGAFYVSPYTGNLISSK
jgi:type II secretory pathway pseudopilin PulG